MFGRPEDVTQTRRDDELLRTYDLLPIYDAVGLRLFEHVETQRTRKGGMVQRVVRNIVGPVGGK